VEWCAPSQEPQRLGRRFPAVVAGGTVHGAPSAHPTSDQKVDLDATRAGGPVFVEDRMDAHSGHRNREAYPSRSTRPDTMSHADQAM
jgi:hypothetical protein